MNAGREDSREAQHDAAGSETDPRPSLGRRLLVGGAAGGLVLAASGLFVPGWLEDVDAREGALGGTRGGRRGKDHKGRNRKRSHGDRKDKDKRNDQDTPRGATRDPLPITVAMTLHNYRSVPVQVQGWQFLEKGAFSRFYVPREWRWAKFAARAANGSPAVKEFIGYSTHAYYSKYVVVQIGTDQYVSAYYDHFRSGAGFLAAIGRGDWDELGPTERNLEEISLAVGESLAKDAIKVTRAADTKEHIRVTVDVM